jgi:ATP-binding cassette subfamily C protein CydCD
VRPVDPRLLRHARHSRGGIALLAAIGIGQALATVGVAVALTLFLTGSRPPAIALLATAFAVRAGLSWAEQVAAHRTAARVSDELRRSLVRAVARRGPAWVAAFGPGRLTALLTGGLDALRPWFAGYLPAVVLGAALPPLVLLAIGRTDPASAVVALLTLPLIPLLGALIGWATQARAQQRWQADARLAGHFLDVVRGLATLRTYGRATRQTAVIEDLTDRHRSATLRVLRVAFLSSTALDLVGTLSVGLIAVSAGLRVAAGHLPLGPALLTILLAPEVYRPLREMAARYHAATDATAVIADVDEVLTGLPEPLPTGTRTGVAASRVRVRYPGAAHDALTLPEVVAGAGELVALTGPSGSGKTTALRALAGLQGVDAGTITVDGAPVYVPQSPSLPHARTVADLFPDGTPAAEIEDALRAVGLAPARRRPEAARATASDRIPASSTIEEAAPASRTTEVAFPASSTIEEAARTSSTTEVAFPASSTIEHAHPASSTIQGALPATDPITTTTPLGEHGAGVSSGQRHRLALAAALFRGPATLLLDEPTAHLDPESEQLVIARLHEAAAAGSAVLVAAHRPALIAAADRLVEITPPDRPARHPGDQAAALATPGLPAPGADHPASEEADPGKSGMSDIAAERAPSRADDAASAPSYGSASAGQTGGASGSPVLAPAPPLRWERWRHPWTAVALGSGSALAGLLLTGAAAWLLVRAASLPPVLTLSAAVVLVRGSAVARPLLRYAERLVSHDLAFARLGRRRARVYQALIPRVPGPGLRRRGDLLTKVVDDVDAQVDGLLRGRLPAWAAAVTLAVGALVAVLVVPLLALPVGAGLLIAGVLAPIVAGRQAARQEAAASEARTRLRDAMVETVDGIEELRGSRLLGVPDRRSRDLAAREAQAARSAGAAGALAHLGWGVTVTGAALVLGHAGLGPEWTAVLLLGLVVLGESASGLPETAVARIRAAAAERRLHDLALAVGSSRTTPAPGWEGTSEPPTPDNFRPQSTDHIQIKDVTAGWGTNPAINRLTLDLPPGTRLAITGRSGTGKTTLGMVLARFLEPRSGTVTLGGRDLRTIPDETIRRKIVLVSDDTSHIFASTVRENLRIAKPTATDDELDDVLRRVHLSGWEHDLDTWLGTGGSTISGGQARRLATARALLADPGLLILDEPTEGLDVPTGTALMRDLLRAAGDRTVLVLTHRTEGLERIPRLELT